METLSLNLYSADAIRQIEHTVISTGIADGYTLMTRAGQAVVQQCLCQTTKGNPRALVLCGPGNNGGDGYVVARGLLELGWKVDLIALTAPGNSKHDALRMRAEWLQAGGDISPFDGEIFDGYDLIIDAILGTGLQRPLQAEMQLAVQLLNASRVPVISVDIPTGLNSETGQPMGSAVTATRTVSFIGWKPGLFIGYAADYCGDLMLDTLAVPAEVYRGFTPLATLMDHNELAQSLAPRGQVCHKGDFGHVLVVGGDVGLSGAARLAAEAASRAGSGLVSVATHPVHAALIAAASPVLMCHGIERRQGLSPLMVRASAVVIGPGLGRSAWSKACWDEVMLTGLPLVMDADGLNHLSENIQHRDNWVLTPHPGEAATLLGVTSSDIQGDRIAAVLSLRARYGGVVVLKGTRTLVAGPSGVFVCDLGNPGMATAGMGDVLSGVIAGLLAQGLSLELAARLGVFVHARAGDLAAGSQPRGLQAMDLMPCIREVVNL